MNHPTKFAFFILFVLKEILSTQTQTVWPSFRYEISSSKSLADWIAKIFKNVEVSSINGAIKNAFASAKNHKVSKLEYNTTHAGNCLQSEISSTVCADPTDAKETTPFILKNWRLSDNKIRLSTKKLRITLEGEIRANRNQSNVGYFTTLHFENFVLEAIRLSNDPNDVKFSFEFSYKSYNITDFGSDDAINSTLNQENQLATVIKPMLLLVLREHINRNPKFSEAFDQITKIYNQPSEIISDDRNFPHHRQQYYYLIPQIHFYGFCLRNVIIQGLLNIESLDVDTDSSFFSHTMLMKNIAGNMILDYGSENQAPLELNYLIDYLSISIQNGIDLVHVEAKSYGVNRTTGAPLTHRQSEIIIRKIECAVATALMPSKQTWKTCQMESDIDEIKITNTNDWKMIEKKYHDWIPFNRVNNAEKKSGLMQRIFRVAAGGCFLSSH